MLSVETESRLAKVLVEIGRGEGNLEMERQYLAKEDDYSPYACFLRIDRAHKGWVNSIDILNFLKDNCIHATESECHYLVKFFDVDLDGRLDYLEFLHIMFPCTNPDLRAIASQKPDYGVDSFQSLPHSLEKHLALLIEKEINHHRLIEPFRQLLASRPDYSPSDCFRQIDILNTGEITMDNLSRFLRRNGHFLNEDQIGDVIRRIDKDADSVVSQAQLREAIDPVEPYIRPSALERSYISSSPIRAAPPVSSGSPLRNRSPPAMRSHSPSRLSPARVATYTTPLKSSSPHKGYSRFAEASSLSTDYATPSKIPPALGASRAYDYSPERSRLSRLNESPLRPEEEDKFVQLVKDQIAIENDLEKAKKDLALCEDFNLIDAFRIIDPIAKGSVNIVDLQDNIKALGIFPTYEECSLFFKHYDTDYDGRIRYSNFCSAFTPKDKEFADLVLNREAYHSRHLHRREDFFRAETRNQLRRCWRVHFDLESEAEILRQRLSRRPLFNVHDAFKTTDKSAQGFITITQLRSLLNEHKFYPSERELINLMDRYDRNKDGRISYSEFVEEVAPKSPRKF